MKNNKIESKFKSIEQVVKSPLFLVSIVLAAISLIVSFVATKSNLLDSVIRVWVSIPYYDAYFMDWNLDTSVLYILIKILLYVPLAIEIVGLIIVMLTVKKGSDDDAGVNIAKLGMASSIFIFFVFAALGLVALPTRIMNVYGIPQPVYYIMLASLLVAVIVMAYFFKVFIDVINIGFESMARSSIASKIPLVFVIGIVVVMAVLLGTNIWMFGLTKEILPLVAGILRIVSYASFLLLMFSAGKEK